MDAPLHPKPLTLPLRLVPRRRVQSVVLGLQIVGLALLAVALSRPFAGDWQVRASAEPVTFGLLVGFLSLAILGVGWLVAVSLLRLLPGSPFSHVRLSWSSIAIRGPLGTRQFAWAELGRFAAVTAPNDYEVNYIVAGPAGQDAAATDDRDRYRRAVFRLRSDPYCSHNEAALLAIWLSEVRSAVAGKTPGDVAFFAPQALSGNLMSEPGRQPPT